MHVRGNERDAAARVYLRFVVADRLVERGHLLVVDGGADDVAAVVDLLLAEVVNVLELVLDHLQDVGIPDVGADALRDVVA